MIRLRILCTKKLNKRSFESNVTHIGGVNGTGEKWNIAVKEAIAGIDSGTYEFFVMEQFGEIPVKITGTSERSLAAIGKTSPHNLLEDLPDCP